MVKVNWELAAGAQLKEICDYIKRDSPQNSVKVKNEILSVCKVLSFYPGKYPIDKYKKDNDGNYRALIVYNYRIAYRVRENEIRIISIRHTSRDPLAY